MNAMNEIIILASGSPRRRELLTQIGISFEVIPALSEERTQSSEPEEICRSLAAVKAEEVAQRVMAARTAYVVKETDNRKAIHTWETEEEQSKDRTAFGETADRQSKERNTSGKNAENDSRYGGIPGEVAVSRRVRIIGADTIVVLRREILGKPKDAEDAARMLTELSGCMHSRLLPSISCTYKIKSNDRA